MAEDLAFSRNRCGLYLLLDERCFKYQPHYYHRNADFRIGRKAALVGNDRLGSGDDRNFNPIQRLDVVGRRYFGRN